MKLTDLQEALESGQAELLSGYDGLASVGVVADPYGAVGYAIQIHVESKKGAHFPPNLYVCGQKVPVRVAEDFELPYFG